MGARRRARRDRVRERSASIRGIWARTSSPASGRPRVTVSSAPDDVETNAAPTTRSKTSGRCSASAIIVIPPMECPASTSGPSGASVSISIAQSRARLSIVQAARVTGADSPWPRWSQVTIRMPWPNSRWRSRTW